MHIICLILIPIGLPLILVILLNRVCVRIDAAGCGAGAVTATEAIWIHLTFYITQTRMYPVRINVS